MASSSYLGMEPVNRTALTETIKLAIAADRPLLVLGSPGIGKSETVREVAVSEGYELVDYRVGNVPPEDLGGLMWPNQETKRVDRYMPDIVAACWKAHEADGKPVVLYLDEINHAVSAVQGPLYSIVLDRMSGGFPLPPGTRILAAGNPEGTGSISEDMSRALLDRFWVVEFGGPTPAEFKVYGDRVGLHPTIQGYLEDNPSDLNAFDPELQVSPTPRAWSSLSKVLKRTASIPMMMSAAIGHVGTEAGQRFAAYVEMFGKLPSFQEVVSNPDTAVLPKDFSGRFMMVSLLVGKLTEFWSLDKGRIALSSDPKDVMIRKQVHTAVLVYVQRLPSELRAAFISSVQRSLPDLGERGNSAVMLQQMLSDFRQAKPEHAAIYTEMVSQIKELVGAVSAMEGKA